MSNDIPTCSNNINYKGYIFYTICNEVLSHL